MCSQNEENRAFHIMAKPAGPECNLQCGYCFYLEKEAILPECGKFRMSDEVLEAYIIKYLTTQRGPEAAFVWHGGEPTLMGLEFFRKAVRLQKKHACHGKRITNSLQTNGTLLNEEWCCFLAKHNFMVGISLDGPREIHDRYRTDRGGRPTFDRVMRGVKLLQKHGVEFNVLACVSRESCGSALDIYRFFKKENINFIQFTPLVERLPDIPAGDLGLQFALPPELKQEEERKTVTPFSVEPVAYGDFLIDIFEEWIRHDVGSVFVMNFESALASWMNLAPASCVFAKQCGRSLVMEHNGDLYSCDHYVYPEYRLGNILTDSPEKLVESERQKEFGSCKETMLPKVCLECEVLFACRGECPKHRFTTSWNNEPGVNYLCPGYRKYYRHIHRYMKGMVQLVNAGIPAERIMEAVDRPLLISLQDKPTGGISRSGQGCVR